MKDGYKMSKLGEIPVEWEIDNLQNHIQLITGFPFKSNSFNEDGKGTKLLRGINITRGKLRWNEKIDKFWDITFDDFDKYSAKTGDLVISMDGSLVGRNYARVKKEELPLLIVQRVACLRAKESLNLEYLNQIIGSPIFINFVDSVKTSSGIPHISAKNIREFKIAFPPLKEQKKIAEILSTVDKKIAVIEERLQATQTLKKGLMQRLLTKGIGHTAFKDSVLGEIPVGWEIVNIENEADVCTGGKDTQDKIEDGKYPFFVRSNTIERINSYSFDGEAVLTSGDGVGVGKIYHYLNCKFDYHQRVYNIHNFSERLYGKYFYYYFSQHFYSRVKRLSAKNSVDSVRKAMITEMKIPLPSNEEQQKIANILSKIDEKIQVLTNKKAHYQTLKKGLMQNLLTGKIRVKTEEANVY